MGVSSNPEARAAVSMTKEFETSYFVRMSLAFFKCDSSAMASNLKLAIPLLLVDLRVLSL